MVLKLRWPGPFERPEEYGKYFCRELLSAQLGHGHKRKAR
jgi:hypothetical protein